MKTLLTLHRVPDGLSEAELQVIIDQAIELAKAKTGLWPRDKGIDVSHWQGLVDWQKVKAAGIKYVFIKASEGLRGVDPLFSRNWQGAKDAGLLRGAYHYFLPDALPPEVQAEHFYRTVSETHLSPELEWALDVEKVSAVCVGPVYAGRVKVFLDKLQALTDQTPMIYTGPDFWNVNLATPEAPAWTADYPLWIANYTTAPKPWLPRGWTGWRYWQYGKTGVAGIKEPVDTNVRGDA